MVNSCCVYGCKRRYRKKSERNAEDYIQFHRFPFRNSGLLAKWTAACYRQNWKPSTYSVICSEHFENADYQIRPGASKRYLKENAIPSVFSFPSHLQAKEGKVQHLLQRNIAFAESSTSSCRFVVALKHPSNIQSNLDKNVQCKLGSSKVTTLQRKIKILQLKLKQRKLKIKKLQDLSKCLRQKVKLHDKGVTTLHDSFSG